MGWDGMGLIDWHTSLSRLVQVFVCVGEISELIGVRVVCIGYPICN